MSIFLILIIAILAILLISGSVIASLVFVIKGKDSIINTLDLQRKSLQSSLDAANGRISALNKLISIDEKGKQNEESINTINDDTYDPNGMFDRPKK